MFELLFTGLYLGAIHLFASPDHLATVFPLSLLDKKRSWQIGLIWGIGHLIGLFFIGILLYYFKHFVNLEFLEHYGMLYIAILLVCIGLWIILKSKHLSTHSLCSEKHQHLSKITLGTGIFHGIFAVSHLYSLAPTISMNNMEFFYYFGGFSLGSVLSVVFFTSLISLIPQRFISSPNFFKKIILGSGILTFILGVLFILLFFLEIGVHSH